LHFSAIKKMYYHVRDIKGLWDGVMQNATTITLARKAESAPMTAVCHDKRPCEVKLANGTIRPMTRYERFCRE
jgi:hypothetical protein